MFMYCCSIDYEYVDWGRKILSMIYKWDVWDVGIFRKRIDIVL